MTETFAQTPNGLAVPCMLHQAHKPAPLTSEYHHLVPVAWQLHWQPAVAPAPGPDLDGRGQLWDVRGVYVAPTCHRNVHWWIVRLMHALAAAGSEDLALARHTLAAHASAERSCALIALEHYQQAGGSLLELTRAKLWGNA